MKTTDSGAIANVIFMKNMDRNTHENNWYQQYYARTCLM